MDLGKVMKRCLATSLATVEGVLPSSLAIPRQVLPRSSILSIAFLSCLSSLGYDLPGPALLLFLPAITGLRSSWAGQFRPKGEAGGRGGDPKTQRDMSRCVLGSYR